MLRIPAPFPQVGSYPLIALDGELKLARIVGRDHGGNALIALPLEPVVASGNKSVPLEELLNADALSAQETAELQRLNARLHHGQRVSKAERQRRQTLDDRERRHILRAPLMRRLPSELRKVA